MNKEREATYGLLREELDFIDNPSAEAAARLREKYVDRFGADLSYDLAECAIGNLPSKVLATSLKTDAVRRVDDLVQGRSTGKAMSAVEIVELISAVRRDTPSQPSN